MTFSILIARRAALFCLGITALFVVNPSVLLAQVSGYMGKRFIVKTDLLAPPLQRGFSLGVEAVILKRLTLTADFIRTSTRHARLVTEYGDDLGNNYDKYNTLKNGKSKIISQGYRLSLRRYLSTSIYAPLGLYVEYAFGSGKSEVHGQHIFYGLGNIQNGSVSEHLESVPLAPRNYTLKNVYYRDYGLGWGIQRVIRDRFSLDCYLGLNYRETWVSNYADTFFDGRFVVEYGYLVRQHKGVSGTGPLTLVHLYNMNENVAIGLHARLQIGYLLF